MKSGRTLLLCLGAAFALPLHADTSAQSSMPMTALTVRITNAGGVALDCQAELAHWYSMDLGIVPPSGDLSLDLWVDPGTGTIATRNRIREFVTVQRIWCGIMGRAYATRWQLPLTPEASPKPLILTCRAGEGTVSCD